MVPVDRDGMLLTAVIVLLIGVCVWGILGHLDTRIATAGTCENGVFTGAL